MTNDEEFRRLERFVSQDLFDKRRLDLYRSRSDGDIFLRFADWLLKRRFGLSTQATMAELDALRLDPC